MIQDIAPYRFYNQYDPQRRPGPASYLLVFEGRETLICADAEGQGDFLRAGQLEGEADSLLAEAVYLFRIDDQDYFLLRKDGMEKEGWLKILPEGCRFENVRALRQMKILPLHQFFAINTARQLHAWYRDNVFCGTCGGKTVHSDKERAVVCTCCHRTIYPRILPAVIIGITHGDELLLTRYSDRVLPFDALVAGFTEIGETLEQTVEREAMEETGLKVRNIRYYKSQPWAIADNILAGFFCDVDGDPTVKIDENELKTAIWTRREDIVGQPDNMSLTGEMMLTFKAGREPK